MKKIYLICTLIIVNVNALAQNNVPDENWEIVFFDDFSATRTWNTDTWRSSDGKWKALAGNSVTHGNWYENQIYQYTNCIFDAVQGTMKLVSEYDSDGRIPNWCYPLPVHMGHAYPNIRGQNNRGNNYWYYFSGEIDVNEMPFHYGYFEIRCKLPIHKGAFPAFWLYGGMEDNDGYYNEIDIFEYSNDMAGDDFYKQYTCGLYCDNGHYAANSYARVNPILPESSPDLRQYHVFGCLWLPDKVIWYVDGNEVNEYCDRENIPQHPMELRTNYAINIHALDIDTVSCDPVTIEINDILWTGNDVMTIDYMKVCQLKMDCDTEETMATQSELDNFDYSVKKSITVSPASGDISVGNTDRITLMATDFVQIDRSFRVDLGGELTVMMQECLDNH